MTTTNTLAKEFNTAEILIWVRTLQHEEGDNSDYAELASADLYGRRTDGSGKELNVFVDNEINIDDFGCKAGDGEWTELYERHAVTIELVPYAIDLKDLEITVSSHGYAEATLHGVTYEFDDGNGTSWGVTFNF